VAWRFKTDAFGPYPEYKLEGTPVMVKGVLYTTAGTRRSVVALDAKTGEVIWSHSPARRPTGRQLRAAVIGTRGLLLDRRPRRRAHHLRDHRLSPGRAERQDRRRDPSFGDNGILDIKVGVLKGNNQQIDLEGGEIGIHAAPYRDRGMW